MEYERKIQNALKTLRGSLEQHETQKKGYERTIALLTELHKTVPFDSKLPLGEIIGILRRTLAIQDFSVLLSLDLRTPLSPSQVIEIIQKAKSTIDSQIKEIHKEISDANSLSILQAADEEILNEEGLPIKDIREEIVDDEEDRRKGVVAEEEQPTRIFTMEEIDRMMDEAEIEEQAELVASQRKLPVQPDSDDRKEEKAKAVAAREGLEVGHVSGEELLAKLVDDSKNRYNPIDGTWVEDEDDTEDTEEGDYDDDDDDDEEEEEEDDDDDEEEDEDKYGRTRGFLIPPNLSKRMTQEKGVKFASFEKPATPSTTIPDKPVKSALKKSTHTPPVPPSATVPVSSTRTTPAMTTNIVERAPKQDDTQKQQDTKATRKVSRFKASRQGLLQ